MKKGLILIVAVIAVLVLGFIMIWLRENPLLQMWDESNLKKKFVFKNIFHIFAIVPKTKELQG